MERRLVFAKQPLRTDYATVAAGSSAWTPVTLPHDWLIYGSHLLYEDGEGWFSKRWR